MYKLQQELFTLRLLLTREYQLSLSVSEIGLTLLYILAYTLWVMIVKYLLALRISLASLYYYVHSCIALLNILLLHSTTFYIQCRHSCIDERREVALSHQGQWLPTRANHCSQSGADTTATTFTCSKCSKQRKLNTCYRNIRAPLITPKYIQMLD